MKSYTDIFQSKKLAEILPIESADMVLPFRHTKNDEYILGYVASRNYVEVYNEMMKLPGMGKEDVCQLIQPAWSEEDEKLLTDAIKYLEIFDAQGIHGNKAVPAINWLKSLKQRMKGK